MKENLNQYIDEKIHEENRRRIRALLKECVYLEQVQRAFADFPKTKSERFSTICKINILKK